MFKGPGVGIILIQGPERKSIWQVTGSEEGEQKERKSRKQVSGTPVFLPGESQGQGNLVGCRLWGHTVSDMTEATQQQQQQQQQQVSGNDEGEQKKK